MEGRTLRAIVPDHHRVVEADAAVGMRVEELDLTLKLVRVRPVVVAVQTGDVLAPAGQKRLGQVPHQPQVVLAEQRANAIRIPVAVTADHRTRGIGGAVLSDDDLEVEIRRLRQRPLDGLADDLFLVVSADQDAGFHDLTTSREVPTPRATPLTGRQPPCERVRRRVQDLRPLLFPTVTLSATGGLTHHKKRPMPIGPCDAAAGGPARQGAEEPVHCGKYVFSCCPTGIGGIFRKSGPFRADGYFSRGRQCNMMRGPVSLPPGGCWTFFVSLAKPACGHKKAPIGRLDS